MATLFNPRSRGGRLMSDPGATALMLATAAGQSDAMKFVNWASSKAYENLVAADTKGQYGGPSNIPAGKRLSTYKNATYLKIAGVFATPTIDAIDSAPTDNPGVQKRPDYGIQFVGIPSFTGFGLTCAQQISSAIAGSESTDSALNKCQAVAAPAGAAAKKAAGK